MSEINPSDELCRMLDERGAEYTVDHCHHEYFWDFGEFGRARASYIGTRGLVQMIVTGLTPAQAIAATLGSGECAMIPSFTTPGTLDDCQEFCCSVCGEYMVIQQFPGCEEAVPSYCPNCGRKVMDE